VDDGPASAAKNDLGLVFRRARVWFAGNLFAPNIKYRVALTFSPIELGYKNGTITRSPILDWFFTFDRFRDATFQVGQYKVPYNHQRMMRITGMQFVDRSTANNEFTLDRDIGLDIRSKDVGGLGHLRYYAGVYLGDGIALYGPGDFGLAYLARVEVLPLGNYDDLEEADHERTTKPKAADRRRLRVHRPRPPRHPRLRRSDPRRRRQDHHPQRHRRPQLPLRRPLARERLLLPQGQAPGRRQRRRHGHPDPDRRPAQRHGLLRPGRLPAAAPAARARRPLGPDLRQRRPRTQTSLRSQNDLGGVFNYYFARHSLKLQLDYFHTVEHGDPPRHRPGPAAASGRVLAGVDASKPVSCLPSPRATFP
jgi:phosphate-selective porin OprO/OprP